MTTEEFEFLKDVEKWAIECNWFSWFVFENDFGKKKMKVKVDCKEYKICDEKQFFDVCIKPHSVSS